MYVACVCVCCDCGQAHACDGTYMEIEQRGEVNSFFPLWIPGIKFRLLDFSCFAGYLITECSK